MNFIEDLGALEALYGTPSEAATRKVTSGLTPSYKLWIERSRFCVLSTVGSGGTDGSPRGDIDPVVKVLDPKTLLLPDWRGNNRIDTLRNIVEDGRISLMFMVPGSREVMRVNGTAKITADEAACQQFEQRGQHPRSVIVVSISEVYPQCAKSIMRSEIWTSGDQSEGLPTLGAMLKEITEGGIDGDAFDAAWPERSEATLW